MTRHDCRPDSRDSVELLPCPFCGSDQVSLSEGETGDGQPWPYVECESCAATAMPDNWNNRQALARGPQQAGGEDAKDAARYRALRNDTYIDRCDIAALSDTDMDAALDAAIASATDAALNGGRDDA